LVRVIREQLLARHRDELAGRFEERAVGCQFVVLPIGGEVGRMVAGEGGTRGASACRSCVPDC
jgi:hypothetical protein